MSFSGTKGYITKPKPGVMLNPLHPLSRGLVGYWLFNEGSGSIAYDISGKGHHGTLIDMSPNVQGSGWGGSKFGGGLHFDGVDDYVDCGDDINNGELTVDLWFKTLYTDVQSVFDFMGTLDYRGHFDFTAVSNRPILLLNANNYIYWNSIISYLDGEWHHLSMYLPGGGQTDIANATLHIDKTLIPKNSDATTDVQLNFTTFWIGHGYINHPFNGSIDSARIYNRALSAAEKKQLYQDPFCNLLQVPIRRYSDVTPPGWTGKIIGVTNPSKILGMATSGISEVVGI